MKLMPGEWVWVPMDKDWLLCVLTQYQTPPIDMVQFMGLQADLLERLVAEEYDEDVELEEQRLSDNLPFEVRMVLPAKPLRSRDGINILLQARVDAGNSLEDWKRDAIETLENPPEPVPQEDAQAMAENLDLAQYLESRVLY